jgi:AcrR family transcriptional regulator
MDTREKILVTAREEFARLGLDGARVDRIAERAGINKAMIYYHFGSKESLYQAVIESHFEAIGRFLERAITEETDPEKFMLRISNFYNSIIEEHPTLFPILLREMAQGGERIKIALTRILGKKGLIYRLKMFIDGGIARGEFRQLDSRQVILSFIGMNLFYLILAPVMNSVWEIEDEKSFREKRSVEVVDLFLHGLKAR